MTDGWRKAMTIWCWAVTLFGAVLIGAAFPLTDGLARLLFQLLRGSAPAMDQSMRFSVGLMGAVTFGWGLSLLAVASVSHRLDGETARLLWRRITAAMSAWYMVDSFISIATGFGLNAVSNTALAIAFALIVWRGGVLAAPPSDALARTTAPS